MKLLGEEWGNAGFKSHGSQCRGHWPPPARLSRLPLLLLFGFILRLPIDEYAFVCLHLYICVLLVDTSKSPSKIASARRAPRIVLWNYRDGDASFHFEEELKMTGDKMYSVLPSLLFPLFSSLPLPLSPPSLWLSLFSLYRDTKMTQWSEQWFLFNSLLFMNSLRIL